MNCPGCQFENREGARFCRECGTDLEYACLKCGTVYQLGSKFCDECGYELGILNTGAGDIGITKNLTFNQKEY
jgi:hypothetical protein